MEKWKIRKGDKVQVIAGKHKGSNGEIVNVNRKDRTVVVSGVNIVSRYKKPTAKDPGGEVKKEYPIHASNVMVLDPDFSKPTRVGFKFNEAGEKIRYSKLSGSTIL